MNLINLFRPTSSDISQIKALSHLGCNKMDMAMVLNIRDNVLEDWEKQNKIIKELLKPKPTSDNTMQNPEFAPMVEEAFAAGGKRFYRFKEEYRMPTGRYKYFYAHLREVDLRANLETLTKYIDAFKLVLNGGAKGKGIQMQSLWELILNLESRIKLAFEPQGVKNMAAVSYFDETEDLTTYDVNYGKEKIKLWEDHGVLDFFLTRPIGELLNLNASSIESLPGYLSQAEMILADLNSGLLKVLEENS